MNETLKKLINANNIITSAYERFDEGEREYQRIEAKYRRSKEAKGKVYLFAAAPFVLGLLCAWCLLASHSFIAVILAAISFAGIAFVARVEKKANKKADEKKKAEIEEAEKIYAEGNSIMQVNINEISFIPADYRYPLAVNYLVQCFRDSRAETMNEALSMFDEQLHRWKMENAQQQMIEQQNAQLRQLGGIRRDIKVNTAVNVAHGVFDVLSRL